MTLIVRRYIPMRRGGCVRYLFNMIIAIALVLTGCSSGRGDWDYDLPGEYSLVRSSAHSILLVRPSGSAVFGKLFVTDFCVNQQYIGVCGISFAGNSATDQELAREERKYYLVEVSDGTIYGPYGNVEEFIAKCEENLVGDMSEWISTKEMDYYM